MVSAGDMKQLLAAYEHGDVAVHERRRDELIDAAFFVRAAVPEEQAQRLLDVFVHTKCNPAASLNGPGRDHLKTAWEPFDAASGHRVALISFRAR